MNVKDLVEVPDVDDEGKVKAPFPKILDLATLMRDPPPLPPALIHGVVHRGHKLLLGGTSKSKKTWTLLDLALSVATGKPWLGFEVTKGRVLYVDFELSVPFLVHRAQAIAKAKSVQIEDGSINVQSLRGFAASHETIFPKVQESMDGLDYSLIILDPLYKLLGERVENDSGDMAIVFNAVEKLAVECNATVAIASHFAKGNAAGKEVQDRVSGSGVMARDPDALFMMTPHEDTECFTCETVLRNFPSVDPFVVHWTYPLMARDDTKDPQRLKVPRGKTVRFDTDMLLDALKDAPLSLQDWREKVMGNTGMKQRTFMDLKSKLHGKKVIMGMDKTWTLIK